MTSVRREGMCEIRIIMPSQLRALARIDGEVTVRVASPVTLSSVLTALESAHPTLIGTIRNRQTGDRRPMIRIYADGEDYSDRPVHSPLPAPVLEGAEPVRLVGAIAGGA